MLTRSIVVASAAALVAGQFSLSSGCTAVVTGILANPDASACLNPTGLIALAGATNTSVIAPLNTWLTGLCAAPACSSATLSSLVTNVTTGCSAELGSGATSDMVLPIVNQYYPIIRKLVCLKESADLCVTKTLTIVEKSFGTLSIAGVTRLVAGEATGANSTIPKEAICSNCAKAAFNILKTDAPAYATNLEQDFNLTCGATYVDGANADGITLSASGATASNTSTTAGSNNGAFSVAGHFGGFAAAAAIAAILV